MGKIWGEKLVRLQMKKRGGERNLEGVEMLDGGGDAGRNARNAPPVQFTNSSEN